MKKQELEGMWDLMRMKYGVYLQLLEAIPADRYGDHPVSGMRTPTELVVHTSGLVRDISEGVASGTISPGEDGEDAVAQGLGSKEDVIALARVCWARADAAVASVGDEQLAGEVGNPWGMPLNGAFAMMIMNDELLHHRGQLYAFARACGAEPPFMWGFQDNPEGFGPQA